MIIIVSNFISDWLKEIVVLFIIISLVDLLMPKGKMKRYVDFIMGIIIIFTVISPFSRLNKITLDIDREVNSISQNLVSESSAIEDQNRQIERIYKENLNNEIKRIIEKNTDYKVKNTDVYIINDKENPYKIESATIILENKENTKNNSTTVKIDKIKVGDERLVFNEDEDYTEVKGLVSNYLNLDANKLIIKRED